MFLTWFRTEEVDALADSLANEFSRRCPAPTIDEQTPQAKNRLKSASELMCHRVKVFSERQRLNLFKRARLANSLKWKLAALGYDKETINALSYEVAKIATLSKAKKT
ncbi:MAG: hypothetical protein JWL63_2500 [Rhodocyclales bacterium]|nr:hypothetical protein [Rhodocyclales bacterium]